MWDQTHSTNALVLEPPAAPWRVEEDEWPGAWRKLLCDQSQSTWQHIDTGEDEPLITDQTQRWLREFEQWLESLPDVPHIPLDALRREHLY
ncbi:MAG TPA: hypothetical protein EYH34_17145 [Planctomycetes bacterium]|nr:hypothetical protein [Planctomycetota bacterium]